MVFQRVLEWETPSIVMNLTLAYTSFKGIHKYEIILIYASCNYNKQRNLEHFIKTPIKNTSFSRQLYKNIMFIQIWKLEKSSNIKDTELKIFFVRFSNLRKC